MVVRRRLLWQDVKLGIVITISVVLLAFGIVAVGGSGSGFWVPKATYYAEFPTASGLYVGSIVMMDGVEVGTVRAIRLKPDGRGVQIEFKVARHVTDRIREDSIVSVENLGLLGDRYLNIRSGSPTAEPVPPGSTLPSNPGSDYNVLFASLAQSIPDFQKSLKELSAIAEKINRGEGLLGALVNEPTMAQDLKQLLSDLRSGKGSLGRLLKDDDLYISVHQLLNHLQTDNSALGVLMSDPEAAKNLKTTLVAMRNLAERIERGEGSLGQMINDPSLYQELKELGQKSNELLDKIQNGENSLAMLVNNRELYDRLNNTISNIEALLEDMRKHPKKYFSVKVGLIAF